MGDIQKLAWGLDEASRATGLSKAFFRKIIAAGELPITRIGARILILDADLRAFLNDRREPKLDKNEGFRLTRLDSLLAEYPEDDVH